ncbi:hypothetical protein CEXT_789611, partial [Caerostris extrusa]
MTLAGRIWPAGRSLETPGLKRATTAFLGNIRNTSGVHVKDRPILVEDTLFKVLLESHISQKHLRMRRYCPRGSLDLQESFQS